MFSSDSLSCNSNYIFCIIVIYAPAVQATTVAEEQKLLQELLVPSGLFLAAVYSKLYLSVHLLSGEHSEEEGMLRSKVGRQPQLAH